MEINLLNKHFMVEFFLKEVDACLKKCVCLVGKPNVGKSTLFNLLIKEKKAIIMDTPGITRDRIYGNVSYNDKNFILIDTGGITSGNDTFNDDIKMQAELAISESDIILFIVSGREELTSDDVIVRDMLLKSNKEVIVVVNKLDNEKYEDNIYNYYELGFEHVIGISAAHKKNINELLELITKDMNVNTKEIDERLRFSVIGRPNVGKSSLINAILNEDRVIVSDKAGTTRDAIDTVFTYDHQEYILVDTAGMRKKGKIYESVERYSLIRSLKAIEDSDVCVLVIDASEGIIEHDKHIASYAIDAGKALVLVVNKWDAVPHSDTDMKKFQELIRNEFQFIPYVNIVFLSAKYKKRINLLMPEVLSAYENATQEVDSEVLYDAIITANTIHAAPSYKGQRLNINDVSQTGIKPPKFTFFVNDKKLVHFSYYRYLENKIRETFNLEGTPIILQFKNKNEK